MTFKFQLTSSALSDFTSLDITPQYAIDLSDAKSNIITAIELEEIYHALVDDYIEFETTVLNAGICHSVRPNPSETDIQQLRRTFNRRLMHVLTLARSYLYKIDYAASLFKPHNDRLGAMLSASKQQQYNLLLGYRVMEALRNSAQHFGFPLHGLSIGSQWIATNEETKGARRIDALPTFSTAECRKDPKFKKSLLRELEDLGPHHDIRLFLREYMAGLSNIQTVFHDATELELKNGEHKILDAIKFWTATTGNTPHCLLLTEWHPDGTIKETQIFDGIIKRRRDLQRENGQLTNLHLTFVSGSIHN